MDFAAFVFAQDDWTTRAGAREARRPGLAARQRGLRGGRRRRARHAAHVHPARERGEAPDRPAGPDVDPLRPRDDAGHGARHQPEAPEGDRRGGPDRARRGRLVAAVPHDEDGARAVGDLPPVDRPRPDGALEVAGRSWDSDGTLSARYWSEATKERIARPASSTTGRASVPVIPTRRSSRAPGRSSSRASTGPAATSRPARTARTPSTRGRPGSTSAPTRVTWPCSTATTQARGRRCSSGASRTGRPRTAERPRSAALPGAAEDDPQVAPPQLGLDVLRGVYAALAAAGLLVAIALAGRRSDRRTAAEPQDMTDENRRGRVARRRGLENPRSNQMQITRSVLDTGPGSAGWFTGSVSIDPVAAPTGAFPVGDAAVHRPDRPGSRMSPRSSTATRRRSGRSALMRGNRHVRRGRRPHRERPRPGDPGADRRGDPRHARLHLRLRPLAVPVAEPRATARASWATRRSASSRRSAPTSARVKVGDVVVMPFAFSDGTCMFCDQGLQTACVHGGFFGNPEVPGAQSRGGAHPAGGRDALRPAGRRGRRADAVAPDALRRDGHRPPRGGRRARSAPARASPSSVTAPSASAA